MAIGDVISDMELSVGNGSDVAIRPADGVEWVLTWIGGEDGAWPAIRWASVADQMRHAFRGGNTVNTIEKSGFGQIGNQVQWPITYTVYIKARNEGGATFHAAYCGIQTK